MSSPINAEQSVAFAGISGANGDIVCRTQYPYLEPVAFAEFEDVFDAVASGKVKLGVIPIENTQAGRVAEIHNLLPATNLHIVAEYYHRVEHHLFGIKGAQLSDLQTVYSHTQALMQCRTQLRQLGLSPMMHPDTAMAGRDIAQWGDKTKGAICPELCGALYGLDHLKANLEDNQQNYTLFVTLSREPVDPDHEAEKVLTSLIFTARSIPAALYKCLGGFATNGVNLLKLESYMTQSMGGAAQFLLTFEGHPKERRVQLALEELGFFSQKTHILGVYPADPKRYSA
jgi:prephenate dehydratase